MGTRADFYVEKYDRLMWVGSLFKDGNPTKIPTDILIQVNRTLYEELVLEFLEKNDSAIRSDGDRWPWPWSDSRMTDYSYVMKKNKVYAYSLVEQQLFDPLKIVQGEDLLTASIPFYIKFPVMNKKLVRATEELLNKYGHQPAEAV